MCFLFFKQKTAYEMRISDWSSDVCSSDLRVTPVWYISKKKGCTCLRTLPSARLRQRSSSLGRTAGNGVHLSKRGDWQQLAKLQIFRKPAFMISVGHMALA